MFMRIFLGLMCGMLLMPLPAKAQLQQYVDNADAKVALWLPSDWLLHVWSISNPSGALSIAMDAESGRQVEVELDACGENERHAWVAGDKAERVLGYRSDAIGPADEATSQLMPDAAAFITTTTRDTLEFSARAFFAVRKGRCYMIRLSATKDDFDASLNTFATIVEDMRFRDE